MFKSKVKYDYHDGKIRRVHLKYKNVSFQMLKQNLVDIFTEYVYCKSSKKNYERNKTLAKHIDKTWILDLLGMIAYGIRNNEDWRYILVVIDNFKTNYNN